MSAKITKPDTLRHVDNNTGGPITIESLDGRSVSTSVEQSFGLYMGDLKVFIGDELIATAPDSEWIVHSAKASTTAPNTLVVG